MADCLDDVVRKYNGFISREEVEDIFHKIAAKYTKKHLMFGQGKKAATEYGIESRRDELKHLSPVQHIAEAAQKAFDEAIHQKKESLRREYLQAEVNNRLDTYIREKGAVQGGAIKSLINLLVGDVKGKHDTLTLEGKYNGILQLDMAEMYDAFDSYMNKWGYKMTEEQAINIVKEMDGEPTGDQAAKSLVDTWDKWAERVREEKIDLGADIRFLKDWRLPQSWDSKETKHFGLSMKEKAKLLNPMTPHAEKIAIYGKAKAAWIDEAAKRIDRGRYVDAGGMPLNDEQLREVLASVHSTITTRGLSDKTVIGQPKSLAQQLGQHRELHFKSAEDWYAFNQLVGKTDIFGTMQGSVIQNARNTALLETFGPNPVTGFQTALMTAKYLDSLDPNKNLSEGAWNAQLYFDEITGISKQPVSERGELFASAMLGLRQWMVATKLGALLLSQINDVTIYTTIAASDGLGSGKALREARKALNPLNVKDRKMSLRLGVATQTVINDIGLRYGEAVRGASFTSKMANMTVRLSGAEWWTDAMKRGYQTLIGFHLTDAVKNGRESMGPQFNEMLRRYGIGDAEWRIIKKAQAAKISGEDIITPVAVKNVEGQWSHTPEGGLEVALDGSDVAVKVAAMMHTEADIAMVTPGAREMAIMRNSTKPGTAMGEFARSIALFKTFSVSLTTKVLPRIHAVEGTKAFRAGLASQFALGMMIAGGMSYQLKQIAFGRNPRDMSTGEFWLAAAMQSGGLGIFGDFMFSDYNRFGGDLMSSMGGPVGSFASDLIKLTIGNARQKLMGKDTKIGAETFQFIKNNTPLMNLWYTRAALDHLLFFNIQEAMNPGYLRRMKRRTESRNDQTFWWAPGDTLPDEAPDLGYALGGSR